MSHLIEAENLYRYYAARCAVRDLSFTLEKGEVVGLLGPNGAGKSTALQMITGNLAPSAGSIRINGIDLLDRPRDAKAALGYLPENPPLYLELTVNEYLRYCARLHRMRRGQVQKAVTAAMERCGLGDAGKRLIGNLSKGYRQRVGIAQAILHQPSAVILDEPTVGLDPIQIREIRRLIRELGAEHGVILSTHILPEVQAACSRVQIIHQGALVFSDSMEGLSRRMQAASLVAAFRNPPEASLLAAVPGVQGCESLEPPRVRMHFEPETNPAEALVEAAVAGGWGLYELTPERRSLEQIFVELTVTDEAPVEAAT